ncbi:2-methylaconitate cis-trans isomerase PrpF family protein [Brevibacillus centrosporus]|uniref:2-methylaconitate cis-trans isomerase PrpF family protein n=1 Tax=Brevibacillus centrosporus TaxID=54910 RepID=UPI002E206394|nr:PrpF domain-containing protein [Brevibacillus centrosporus]
MHGYGQLIKVRATIMRGGTSKGIILRKYDLPADAKARDEMILRIFGSPDHSQIDGLGGGTSLTSKLAIVGPPTVPGAHIDYTFGQVSLENKVIDYHVTCGNIVTAVGLYAAEEGFVPLTEPVTEVRVFNTNTKKITIVEIPVEGEQIVYEGDFSIDGVPGQGSKIMLNFLDSGGIFTGKTLPTGNATDTVTLKDGRQFAVSIIDCSNLVVFVRAEDVGIRGTELQNEFDNNEELLDTLEQIRIEAGVAAGLIQPGEVVKPTTHALPKIGVVTSPKSYVSSTRMPVSQGDIDITSRYLSMGKLHKAYAVSGAIALAAAKTIPGTIPHEVARTAGNGLSIGHPSGMLYVEAAVEPAGLDWRVTRAACGRTARRLMDGFSYIPAAGLLASEREERDFAQLSLPNMC